MATHNFTKHGWGHGISIFTTKDGGLTASILGHSSTRIHNKDYIVAADKGSADHSRYQVKKVVYKSNPRDMFEAQIKFAPRTPEEKQRDQEQIEAGKLVW